MKTIFSILKMSNYSINFYKNLGIIKNNISKDYKIPKMEEDDDIIILDVIESSDVVYLYTKKPKESTGK